MARLRQTLGGRSGRPLTHSSYTTTGDTTAPAADGCGTTNTIAGITCPKGDTICGFERTNTLRARNGYPPMSWEQWTGQDRDASYSEASTTARAPMPRGDQAGTGPTIRMTDKAGVGNAGRA